jgi:hypothetical protein
MLTPRGGGGEDASQHFFPGVGGRCFLYVVAVTVWDVRGACAWGGGGEHKLQQQGLSGHLGRCFTCVQLLLEVYMAVCMPSQQLLGSLDLA